MPGISYFRHKESNLIGLKIGYELMSNNTNQNIIYLDNSSTTRPYDEVLEYMIDIQQESWGNPSSVHNLGIKTEKIINSASNQIAETLNTKKENIIFTSGGTESNNMALLQPFFNLNKMKGKHIIISAIEHPSVYEPVDFLKINGVDVTVVPVDSNGQVDTEKLRSAVTENTVLISIMYVNNEVGTIQPIEEICKIKEECKKNGNNELILHTDAVQAYGKMHINLSDEIFRHIDLLTISAHKIHGPKGIGALYTKNPQKTKPFIRGGGQQRGLRSGTENVPAIAGFGLASQIQHEDLISKQKGIGELRESLLGGLKSEVPDTIINSPKTASLNGIPGDGIPNILSVSFPGTKGEVILHSLEQNGIYVSTESACSSKKKEKSHVLSAMGLSDDEAEGTLRFSLSAFNTIEEINHTVAVTKKAVAKFRKLTGYRK